MLKRLYQFSVMAGLAVLTASFGLGGSASAASIVNTGPGSTNVISVGGNGHYSYKNKNNVGVNANTNQNASTGNATVGGGSNCGGGCDYGHNDNCRPHDVMKRHKKSQSNPCQPTYDDEPTCNVCSWNPCKKMHRTGGNTNGGDANSGDAKNQADTEVDVSLHNKAPKSKGSHGVGNASIENTGPHSKNIIKYNSGSEVSVKNRNNVDVNSNTNQNASTGNATVSGNTNGGNATSGDASNHAETAVDVEISNSSAPAWHTYGHGGNASIDTTGPGSLNKIYYGGNSSTHIKNTNNVDVNSNTNQNASTGNATVSGNTNGGNATSGDASNHASTSTSVSISN